MFALVLGVGAMIVQYVEKIHGHPVVPVLAMCMVETGQWGAYDVNLHWEQSALYVEDGGRIVAALSYHKLDVAPTYYVDALFVEPAHRRKGLCRSLLEELKARAVKDSVECIEAAVARDNAPMRALADAIATPKSVGYEFRVPKPAPEDDRPPATPVPSSGRDRTP